MLIAIIPVLILIVGLLLWFGATNAKVSEAGRIMFFCGLLVLTWALSRSTIRIG